MKKLLTTLLLIILALVVLTSCQSTETPADDTDNTDTPGVSETTKEDEAPESPFKKPDMSMRDWVVDYMYKMANIKWTPKQTMDLRNDSDGDLVGKTLIFEKGTVYHGLPYINLTTDTDYEDFEAALDWDEAQGLYIYDCPADRSKDEALGNDCSSAILLAYKRFDTNIAAIDTGSCFPLGAKSGIYALGDMVIGENDRNTETIVKNTDVQTHYQALALLQKGDTIIWRTDAGHTRMILENHVEKNNAGKINGGRSYVKCIEQTNSIDAQRKDGVKTNWYVEHTYSYDVLREKNYIPVTCKALSAELEEPVVEVKGANTQKTIANVKAHSLLGDITSNYSIISATVSIIDSNGNVLYTERHKPHNKQLCGSLSLKKFDFDFDMSTLAAGSYTYDVTVETVCGTGTAYSVQFTK